VVQTLDESFRSVLALLLISINGFDRDVAIFEQRQCALNLVPGPVNDMIRMQGEQNLRQSRIMSMHPLAAFPLLCLVARHLGLLV